MCEQLPRGRLLLALRRPIGAAEPIDVVLARPGAIHLHHRQMAVSRAGAVFTNQELLESEASRYGWTTGRGALQHIAPPDNLALQLLIQKREAAGLAGVHVNPHSGRELRLDWYAVNALMTAEPFSVEGARTTPGRCSPTRTNRPNPRVAAPGKQEKYIPLEPEDEPND